MTGNYDDYDEWPDLVTPKNMGRLLDMFPESKLLRLHAFPQASQERKAAWEDLGVTDPLKQAALEVELDEFINSLAKKKSNGISNDVQTGYFTK